MPNQPNPDPIKILIIDDDHAFQNTLSLALGIFGAYQVAHAYDGQQGVAMAQSEQPDLILLDMSMPKMDGLVALQKLRDLGMEVPVIFMTAMGTERTATEAFRLGVRDYLAKPFGLTSLEEVITKLLRTIELEREKEALMRQLLLAEGVQTTMVALSHHINNQLQVALNASDLVEEAIQTGADQTDREYLLDMIGLGQTSLTHIADTLRVLERITAVDLTHYDAETMMLDLNHALKEQQKL
jgi:two-component system NtrC family sensor kinase